MTKKQKEALNLKLWAMRQLLSTLENNISDEYGKSQAETIFLTCHTLHSIAEKSLHIAKDRYMECYERALRLTLEEQEIDDFPN